MKTTTLIAIVVIVVVIVAAVGAYLALSHKSSSTITMMTTTSSVKLPPGATELPYNPNNKTVFIYLVVSVTGPQFNYNGTSYGQMKIYVPAGWNVMVILTNDQPIPHNANIVLNDTPTPNSPNITQDGKILLYVGDNPSDYNSNGVPSQGTASGILTNIQPGYYWIACGIYSHAESGMWVDLIVSNSVSVPYSIITSSPSTTTTTSTSSPPSWG